MFESETKRADCQWSFRSPNQVPLTAFSLVDQMLEAGDGLLWTNDAQGYHVAMNAEIVNEELRDTTRFSSRAVIAIDPNPQYLKVPSMADPPEHTIWRRQWGRISLLAA